MGGMAEHSGDVQSRPLLQASEEMTYGRGRMALCGASRALVLPGIGVEAERGRLRYTVTSSLGTHPIFLPHLLPSLLHLLLAPPPLTSKRSQNSVLFASLLLIPSGLVAKTPPISDNS